MNKWIIGCLLTANLTFAQDLNSSSVVILKTKLQKTTVDTIKINLLNEISNTYKYSNAPEGIKFGKEALLLAEKVNWKKGKAAANENLGICNQTLSNFPEALNYMHTALQLYEQLPYQSNISATLKNTGLIYLAQKKYPEALSYFKRALKINQNNNSKLLTIYNVNDIANVYFKLNNFSKALDYYSLSIKLNQEIKDNNGLGYCYSRIGEIHANQKKYSKAVSYFSIALQNYDKNQTANIDSTLNQLSTVYLLMSESDLKNKNKYVNLSNKTLKLITAKPQEYSQSVENLKETLKKTIADTTRINILNRIASSYFYSTPKEGIQYAEQALQLANKIKWKKGIALASNHLGVCQWVLTDYPRAIKYYFKSLTVYEELKDQNGISGTYNNLGLVNAKIKEYKKAFEYFYKAYRINKKTGNKVLMVYNLNNIASVYSEQKQYEKALFYYHKSEALNNSMSDLNGLAYNYAQIGKIYTEQKQFEKSLVSFKKALENYDNLQTYNIGGTYLEMGISYYKMALENPSNKKYLLANSVQYLNESIHLFTKIGALDRLSICFLKLYEVKKEQGITTEALSYFEKHTTLKDSLYSNENQNKIANIEIKREIDIKDKQIEIQKLKINSDARKVYLLITITLSITTLLLFFFWLYLSKRSTNELLLNKNNEISNINKQKDKFFSIIAHDLRGPFNGFLGLTELLAEEIDNMDKEEIEFSAVNMRSSATNLSRLLDNLLEWSRMEQGLIPFLPQEINLIEIVKECVTNLQDAANKKSITINTTIDENLSILADRHILQSVIRNILSNAVKFTSKGGTVTIQAKEDIKNVTVSIKDSGIGMDSKMLNNIFKLDVKSNRTGTDNEPSTGLGLILCKEFVEKHGGNIWVESEEGKGSTFYFNFPKTI